jgi:hypothetical protein
VRVVGHGRAEQACAILDDSTLACWGIGWTEADIRLAGPIIDADVGYATGCAVTASGELSCWGDVGIPPSGTFSSVTVGTKHACAIEQAGATTCWGDSPGGPPAIPDQARSVSAGDLATCWVDRAGSLSCWDECGLVEDSDITAGSPWLSVSVGIEFVCASAEGGASMCWDTASWRTIDSDADVTQTVAGAHHHCELHTGGSVVCEGEHLEEGPPFLARSAE